MEGYFTSIGYFGYIEGRWMLFATESDYYEFMEGDDR